MDNINIAPPLPGQPIPDPPRDIREVYYEVYFDGVHQYEGTFEDCRDMYVQALDDDLAEVFQVTIYEQKVVF